jgi:hypothetical protein
MEQRHDVPAVVLRGAGGKRGVEIAGDGEQGAHDVVGLELVGLDQGAQQLVGGGEDLGRVVALDRGGAANTVQPGGGKRHGR